MKRDEQRGGPLEGATMYMAEVRASKWEALCAFYGTTLGLPQRMLDSKGRFAMYGGAAPFVAVVGRDQLAAGVSRVVLDFVVKDLDACLAALRGRGVQPAAAPETSPEGYRIARIADPEGNEIHLFEWSAAGAPQGA